MNEISHGVRALESRATPSEHGEQPLAAAAPTPNGRGPAVLGWLATSLPTLFVLLGLGCLAYWGHHTGWTIPKFSALTGNGRAEEKDWCKEHAVPESQCVECNKGLLARPKAHGWCNVHGIQDCPLDNPDVAQMGTAPSISEAGKKRAKWVRDFAQRKENNSKCKLHPRRIQVASQEVFAKMGIDPAEVSQDSVEEFIMANGEVTYDPSLVARLASPIPGRVWRVEESGKIGQQVKKGDVLALVDAAEVGKAKAEFLQAIAQVDLRAKTVKRLEPYKGAAVSGAQFQEAEAALREAQIRLVSAQQALVNLGLPVTARQVEGLEAEEIGRRMQFLGLPDSITKPGDRAKALDPRTTTGNLIPIKAPFDGVVISRRDVVAVVGETVDASKTLFVVADPRRMVLTLHVPQDSLKPFREKNLQKLLGDKTIRFVPDGTEEEVTGTISWISTGVDKTTRALEIRAELANLQGGLRANTFGAGRIVLRHENQAVVVPNEALHWDGNCNIVFVFDKKFSLKDAPKVFHVRTVLPGVQDDRKTEIIAGLLPGEMVAARNSAVLRAELLKNLLGEG